MSSRNQSPSKSRSASRGASASRFGAKKNSADADLRAVRADGMALEYIKNQTPEMCIAAVKQNPMALKFVKEQTYEICKAAIRRIAYNTAKELDVDMDFVTVKRDGKSMNAVKFTSGNFVTIKCLPRGKTAEFVETAMKNHMIDARLNECEAFRFVKDKTPELCLAAVKANGCALKYIKNQTPELCLAAVKANDCALKYVKNQTPELCLTAIRQNKLALCFVKIDSPEIESEKAMIAELDELRKLDALLERDRIYHSYDRDRDSW